MLPLAPPHNREIQNRFHTPWAYHPTLVCSRSLFNTSATILAAAPVWNPIYAKSVSLLKS